MKYLLINRHAKSSFPGININDCERPLNEKGFHDASVMGKRLHEKQISFDLMLSSTAIRALTTCQLIAAEIEYSLEAILTNKDIYGADATLIKKIISNTDSDKVESLSVFGHNPALHMLAEEMSGRKIERFSECSMLYVRFNTVKWSNAFNKGREIVFLDSPENRN